MSDGGNKLVTQCEQATDRIDARTELLDQRWIDGVLNGLPSRLSVLLRLAGFTDFGPVKLFYGLVVIGRVRELVPPEDGVQYLTLEDYPTLFGFKRAGCKVEDYVNLSHVIAETENQFLSFGVNATFVSSMRLQLVWREGDEQLGYWPQPADDQPVLKCRTLDKLKPLFSYLKGQQQDHHLLVVGADYLPNLVDAKQAGGNGANEPLRSLQSGDLVVNAYLLLESDKEFKRAGEASIGDGRSSCDENLASALAESLLYPALETLAHMKSKELHALKNKAETERERLWAAAKQIESSFRAGVDQLNQFKCLLAEFPFEKLLRYAAMTPQTGKAKIDLGGNGSLEICHEWEGTGVAAGVVVDSLFPGWSTENLKEHFQSLDSAHSSLISSGGMNLSSDQRFRLDAMRRVRDWFRLSSAEELFKFLMKDVLYRCVIEYDRALLLFLYLLGDNNREERLESFEKMAKESAFLSAQDSSTRIAMVSSIFHLLEDMHRDLIGLNEKPTLEVSVESGAIVLHYGVGSGHKDFNAKKLAEKFQSGGTSEGAHGNNRGSTVSWLRRMKTHGQTNWLEVKADADKGEVEVSVHDNLEGGNGEARPIIKFSGSQVWLMGTKRQGDADE